LKSVHVLAATHVYPLVLHPVRKSSHSLSLVADLSPHALALHTLFSHPHRLIPSLVVAAAKQTDFTVYNEQAYIVIQPAPLVVQVSENV
jgi:hypothetical protein